MDRLRPIDWAWLAVIACTLLFLALRDSATWLITFPEDWVVPITPWLNTFMDWCVEVFGPFFRAFSAALDVPMSAVRDLLRAHFEISHTTIQVETSGDGTEGEGGSGDDCEGARGSVPCSCC